jgi:thioredoxin 1
VQAVLQAHPDLPYVWVEDGPGRALGRSYRVKLWPTLIGLVNGEERFRLVRPTRPDLLPTALQALLAMPPA